MRAYRDHSRRKSLNHFRIENRAMLIHPNLSEAHTNSPCLIGVQCQHITRPHRNNSESVVSAIMTYLKTVTVFAPGGDCKLSVGPNTRQYLLETAVTAMDLGIAGFLGFQIREVAKRWPEFPIRRVKSVHNATSR